MTPCPEPGAQTGSSSRVVCARACVIVLIGVLAFSSGIECGFAGRPDSTKPQKDSPPSHSAPTPVLSWDNGMHLRSRDGKAQAEIGGEIQIDGRFFADSPPSHGIPSLLLRRGRLVVIGSGFNRLSLRVTAESRKNGPFTLRDAYVDIGISKQMWIRIGKGKSGIGLERMQSNRYLMLAERALPSGLIPDRDIGVQLYGNILRNRVAYMGGLFRGVPDGGNSETSTNHGADGEFRVFTYPFRGMQSSIFRGLGAGIGGSAGRTRGTLPTFTTAGLAQFFSYRRGAIADGVRTRISPQADFYRRRLGVLAEYAISAQEVRLGNVVRRVSDTAWQASASFVLTGENASYSGVVPAHAFNPANHHWGAFEVAGRLDSLRVGPSAFPLLAEPSAAARKASGFGAGLNWYPQRYVKVVFNYVRTGFAGGAIGGNRPTENAFITRLQFSYY